MLVQLFMEACHLVQTQLLKALNKFRTKQVSNVIFNSKSKLANPLKSEIGINWLKIFNKS